MPNRRRRRRSNRFATISVIFNNSGSHSPIYWPHINTDRNEGREMLIPRWLTRVTIPVIVSAGLTAGTAIAAADSTDDAYLAKLRHLGFSWNSSSDSDMISMGHAVCADRMAGKTPDAIAGDLHSSMSAKGFTFADMTGWVSAAESTYCPD